MTHARNLSNRGTDFVSVKDFGAVGDGVTDDATAILAAITYAATGKYTVFFPTGTYICGQQIQIPNCVALVGANPSATTIKLKSGTALTSFIKNTSQDGTQEYAFLQGLYIDGNKGGGATCSTAVVDFVSLFVHSYIRDCIIANGSAVNLHLGANAAAGPVLVDNTWIVSAGTDNVLLDESNTNVGAVCGYNLRNCTLEHQGGGYAGVRIKGYGHILGVNITQCHIEQANTATAGTKAIYLDGAANVNVDGLDVLSASSSNGGIYISSNGYNVRYTFRKMSNTNLIVPFIDDQRQGFTLATGKYGTHGMYDLYQSSDSGANGIFPAAEQTLTYGTTVNTDMAQGNYCFLTVTNGTGFTLANPTNARPGEILTYEIVNASGGAMGAITWGGAFAYRDTSWTNPANGKRRIIAFKYRSAGSWIQIAPATGDM